MENYEKNQKIDKVSLWKPDFGYKSRLHEGIGTPQHPS